MYWIYLFLFILIIFTPEFIQDGLLFFGEEDIESLLIFCFGMLGLLLYLGKESALVQAIHDRLFLQRETNQIRKDLSQSYTYIGEMNRRFEIVKTSLVALPTTALRVFSRQKRELYQPIFDAVQLLTQSSGLMLVFVSIPEKRIVEKYDVGKGVPNSTFTGAYLLESKKFFWEEKGYIIIRSPEDAFETAAYLILEKVANRLEYTEVYQILAAEALFLYCIDRKKLDAMPKK